MFCPFFVFGTFWTGFKGLCFRVGTKMQQANRILNGASSLTSHLIIGIASWWFRAGCLGLFRFWFRATLVCVPCFPPPRREKIISPQKLVGFNRFLRYWYPKPNGTFWAFDRPPCHPSNLLRSNLSTVQLSFQKSHGSTFFVRGNKDICKKKREPKWGGGPFVLIEVRALFWRVDLQKIEMSWVIYIYDYVYIGPKNLHF